MAKPNILLITTDQQRYDTIGANGSAVARTPNIDRLCREGVRFRRAYVQNTVCIPSRACIQTGRYTHQHGVRYMESVIDATPGLPAHEVTVMERLQAAGYATGATGKIHMMPERGFDWMEIVGGKGARWTQATGQDIGPAPLGRQYAEWLEARHPGAYELIYEQRRQPEYRRDRASVVHVLPLEEYVETYIVEKSVEFMTRRREGPFFLWCGFCGPHGPHDPPASHAGLYPPEAYPRPETWNQDLGDRPPHLRRPHRPLSPADEASLRRYRSLYWCLCTLLDDCVGVLLAAMDRLGLLDNTLILYTSDHGEMLGDFRMFGKGNFYEPVVHVPLLARPPGGCAGRPFDGLVEVMDIAPTILEYAGIERPREMQAVSLRPILEGGAGGHGAVLSEYTSNDRAIHGKCLVTERFKYILWNVGQGGEFYDLAGDPQETRNLYYDPRWRDERDRHAEMLLAHLMQSETGYNAWRTAPY
ncbi:MAG: sulfatase-like hydrolase/transferase [Lentisphaeria bacterium]|nr:sulfatase-like hydrolase/transferase [Lentisphaeria bacterium]